MARCEAWLSRACKRWAAAAVALLLSAAGAVAAECRETQVDLRGDFGTARFTVELAQTREEISLGLMNRPSMPASAGMLFVYEAPRAAYFWMKNTLIPLDMLFVSPEGVVTRIHENAVPLDETIIPGGDNVQYVLEINGGMSALLGIEAGAELRHPVIPASRAAWPCE